MNTPTFPPGTTPLSESRPRLVLPGETQKRASRLRLFLILLCGGAAPCAWLLLTVFLSLGDLHDFPWGYMLSALAALGAFLAWLLTRPWNP